MKYVVSIHDKAYQKFCRKAILFSSMVKQLRWIFAKWVTSQCTHFCSMGTRTKQSSNEQNKWQVLLNGMLYDTEVLDEHIYRMRQASGEGSVGAGEFSGEGSVGAGEFQLKAPMPGLVLKIPVMVSQEVEKGDILLILESMKMQNELKAPRAGIVTAIRVKHGDSVNQNQIMVVLD